MGAVVAGAVVVATVVVASVVVAVVVVVAVPSWLESLGFSSISIRLEALDPRLSLS